MAEAARDGSTVRVIAEYRLMVNVVTAYERVAFRLTDSALEADWPVPILGVLPLSRVRRQFPLLALRSIRLVPVVFPSRLLVMAALALAPVVFQVPLFVTTVTGVLAVLFMLLSIVMALEVTTDEETTRIPVCLLQRKPAQRLVEQVRDAGRTRRTS